MKLELTILALLAATTTISHARSDAIGAPGQAAKVQRTIEVDMTDAMRFTPANVTVKPGETVRFVVKNSGQLRHEFVIGTIKELKEHAELMKKHPGMEHAEPNMITLDAGKTGEVIWQFTNAGKVDFACLQPGHYDAGMKGLVLVSASNVADTAPAGELSEGEVRKVDKAARKLTLKHGELKNLDMPGMTMVFSVKDPSMLDALQPGAKVRFRAERVNGTLTVTQIEAAR